MMQIAGMQLILKHYRCRTRWPRTKIKEILKANHGESLGGLYRATEIGLLEGISSSNERSSLSRICIRWSCLHNLIRRDMVVVVRMLRQQKRKALVVT